jgi:signal transduction histidine kinase
MPSPHLTELDIVKVLENSVQLYNNHPSGKVVLTLNVASINVMGDNLLLSRVFSNIILNGLQSASTDSKVTLQISVALVQQKCIIRFIDDGIGMDKEVQERMFTPYFSTKKAGSGLGLAIAKQGIEQCGGKIGFVSEVGKGTEFWIELDPV